MNSDMSILIRCSSEPNMNSASALASSVLPTPVGPRKMNEPIGRFGFLIPARARRTALARMRDRLVLADDPVVQRVLHLEQPLGFLAGDAHDRDAGPHRDDARRCPPRSRRSRPRSWSRAAPAPASRCGLAAFARGRAAPRPARTPGWRPPRQAPDSATANRRAPLSGSAAPRSGTCAPATTPRRSGRSPCPA